MAELASGAVSSLLGLLRNEAQLLARAGCDMKFIKDEMESMHSFLEHLARTEPPAGGHDEQVRTWMKQVQDLAHDCSNCIDLYIRRGDREVYCERGGRLRYLWWVSWLVQKRIAQHKAAILLRDLKERARDVGKRRLRYDVHIPGKERGAPSSSEATAAEDKDEVEEDEDDQNQAALMADGSDPRQRALEPRYLEEYCTEKLASWLDSVQVQAETENDASIKSIAIVAPDDSEDAGSVARDSLDSARSKFESVWINLSALHYSWDLPLLPDEILCYILLKCEQQEQQVRAEQQQQQVRAEQQQQQVRAEHSVKEVYRYKFSLLGRLQAMISNDKIVEKIENIKSMIGNIDEGKKGEIDRKGVEEPSLDMLLRALYRWQNVPELCELLSLDEAIQDTAYFLKDYMDAEDPEPRISMEAENPEPHIRLDYNQYKKILKKVFLSRQHKPPQPQPQDVAAKSETTLGDDQIKDIIHNHKITLDVIWELLRKQQPLEGNFANARRNEDTGNIQQLGGRGARITLDITWDQVTDRASIVPTDESNQNLKHISGEVQPSSSTTASIKETKDNQGEVQASSSTTASVKETKDNPGEVQTSSSTAASIKETNPGEVQANSSTTAPVKETKDNPGVRSAAFAAALSETKEKMDEILEEIQNQLPIKGVVDKIKQYLKDKKTLIVIQDDGDYVSTAKDDEGNISPWEETINALNLLGCSAGSAVIVLKKESKKARDFCYPSGEPITCSLVGLYHDIVIRLTQQQMYNGNDGNNSHILRDILDTCHPYEFCMQMFAQALYANPNRSAGELKKLLEDLKSQTTLRSKAKKIIKFSYKDLPREYKTCLLYLAIFPQGHNIKRSTLIGRWVTEGLITKQDWHTAVRHADRCFDALIKRGLVLPCDIGATGKVKSCKVGDQVHWLITKIANKQHILDARLSGLWARHFSIFSGLRLRATDSIDKFVHKLPKNSPQLSLLKVLDLEGTICLDKKHYLKNICKKILLLKYLSLRGTNVTYLPSEINNLHELEVLDIRQTMLPEHATRHILLLKLRRLLANGDGSSSRLDGLCYHVQIPCNIEKMENLEVLSSLKASRDGRELKGLSNLWQLRKLGVVIKDSDNHLNLLLGAICDLNESIQSLSITISSDTKTKSSPFDKGSQDMKNWLTPKHLESLSINGVTQRGVRGQLLDLLTKGSEELSKVTLGGTLLKQKDFTFLSLLPKLNYVRLRSNAYNGSILTFNKDGFSQLKYFIVEGTNMTEADIKFEEGATAELEKIVLSFSNIRSLVGIDKLPKLKELELEGNKFLLSFSQDRESPEQSTDSRPLDTTESRIYEENINSRAAEQIREGRATEQNTQIRAPEQDNKSKIPEQNSETRAAEQNTESKATEGITQSGVPKQNNESNDPTQDNQSRATEQNTEVRAPKEDINKIGAPAQDMESRASCCESRAREQNKEGRGLERNFGSSFTFKEGRFQHLRYLRVEDSKKTNIAFKTGAAPELRKIALSLGHERSEVTGVNDLPKLKEVELKGEMFLLSFF